MTQADIERILKEQEERLRADLAPWWAKRWAAIKADWQTSAFCVAAGAVLAKVYPYVIKFLSWVA